MAVTTFFLSSGVPCIKNFYTKGCPTQTEKDKRMSKIFLGSVLFDLATLITCLTCATLGLFSYIGMPNAAAYALFSVGGVITLSWIGLAIFVLTTKHRHS